MEDSLKLLKNQNH